MLVSVNCTISTYRGTQQDTAQIIAEFKFSSKSCFILWLDYLKTQKTYIHNNKSYKQIIEFEQPSFENGIIHSVFS